MERVKWEGKYCEDHRHWVRESHLPLRGEPAPKPKPARFVPVDPVRPKGHRTVQTWAGMFDPGKETVTKDEYLKRQKDT